MCDGNRIVAETLSAQAAMFRLAERDYGLTAKRLSLDTGIPLPTLRTKIAGTVLLTIAEFNRVAAAGVPDALLSLMTEPGGKDVVTPPGDDVDPDALASDAAEFVATSLAARGSSVTPLARDHVARSARLFVGKWARAPLARAA